MKKITILFLLLCIAAVSFSQQSKMSPYTRHFINQKKQTSQSASIQKRFMIREIGKIEYINSYIYFKKDTDPSTLREYNVKINSQLDSLITAQIPVNKIEDIAALDIVKYIQIGTPIYKRMDIARNETYVSQVQKGTELNMPYLGKDVVVGIIDNGFEYGHINFYNANKTELRVKRVWNQNTSQGSAPSNFSYGTEYTTTQEMLNAQYDYTTETHGTHVTGIAAGADKSRNFQGIAGEADIVLVSVGDEDVDLSNAIKYIYEYAESVNKPCVINMSLGTHIGPHDGTSTFDQFCDGMQGNGRLMVGSAGNEGDRPLHLSKSFSSSDSQIISAFYFSDPAETGEKSYILPCDIWGEVGKNYQVEIFTYNKSNKQMTKSKKFNANTSNGLGEQIILSGVKNGYANIYTGIDYNNNKPNIYLEVSVDNLSGYYVGIIISATEGTVHAWTHDYYGEFSDRGISEWYAGDTNCTVGEIGGTGKRIISVGAYNNQAYGQTGSIADFSSHGPTADGRIKPDISAPGAFIISSYSNAYGVINDSYYGDMLTNNPTIYNGEKYYYGYMAGTSMSSPFITGVLATWLQANPQLNPEDVRSILKTTSRKDNYTGNISENGNNIWGFGKIDAWNGIKKCVELAAHTEEISATASDMILYPAGNGIYNLLFGKDDQQVLLNIYHINGKQIYHTSFGNISAGQSENISLKNVPQGIYIIRVDGKNIHKSIKVIK